MDPNKTPRLLGHALTVIVGVCSFGAGIAALAAGLTGVLGVTLLIIGGLLPVLAHFSWRYSRAAWSVMISTLVVFGAVTFFGAPKIRGILHVPLLVAMIIPAVLITGVIALAMIRGDYHDRTHT